MPTAPSQLPIYGSHGEGNWGGKVTVNDSKFARFVGKGRCGERVSMFARNPKGSDKIPPHFFNRCELEDVDDGGFAFLEKPTPAWANVKDCGNFPCTAPNNIILSFAETTYKGLTPTSTPKEFVIVPDDETVGGTYGNCVRREEQ